MLLRARQLCAGSAALLALCAATWAETPAAVAAGPVGAIAAGAPSPRPFIAPQARPTERAGRPAEGHDPSRRTYNVPEAPRSPACGPNFCVHWVAEGLDAPNPNDSNGNRIPDYVELVRRTAEHVHEVENERLGWREPKGDGRRGGAQGKTDIYISEVGGALFGYAAPDRGQERDGHIPRRLHGYLVLDNNYSQFEFPGTSQLQDIQVTLAHEYNHILQFGYDAFQDPWFAESTATWMENQVYPELDDYLRYVRRWGGLYDTPLTASTIKEYGSAVWNDWLAVRYGPALIRRAWVGAIHVRPAGFAVGSYDSAIRAAGSSDFSRDFARFATAIPEWRSGELLTESSRYPDVPRQGRVALNGRPTTVRLNHTTFRLLHVRARGGRAVVLRATAPRGVAAGLAIVGRLGSERRGEAVRILRYRPGGGRLTVRLPRPGRFSRITAELINADARAGPFNARRLDWGYLTDGVRFELRGRLLRGALPEEADEAPLESAEAPVD